MQDCHLLFYSFINDIKQKQIHKRAFKKPWNLLEINLKDLGKFSVEQIISNREILLNKIQSDIELQVKMQSQWFQSEKKIYNWLFFCYLELHNKDIDTITHEDYGFLSKITTNKSTRLIEFQTLHLCKQPTRPKWTQEEDQILFTILQKQKQFKTQGQWSIISRELFMRGRQPCIKLGKHVRQRWLNHLNPSLNKQWTPLEDSQLMKFIRDQGKKWSSIVRLFNSSKNEHMIKNRFYSLIKKAKKKRHIEQASQLQLINLIIRNIQTPCEKKIVQTQVILPEKKEMIKTQIIQEYNFSMNFYEVKDIEIKQEYNEQNEQRLLTPLCLQRQIKHKEHLKVNDELFTKALEMFHQPRPNNVIKTQSIEKNDEEMLQPLKISRSTPYNTQLASSPYPPTPNTDLFSFPFMRQEFPIQGFRFNFQDFVKKQAKR